MGEKSAGEFARISIVGADENELEKHFVLDSTNVYSPGPS